MVIIRYSYFMSETADKQMDLIFGALSDRSRRRMLLDLTKGEKSVLELGSPLGISKQLVSKHLKVLENAGLINKTKDGRVQRCKFNSENFDKAQSLMNEYKKFWNKQFDVLENYIETLKENDDE
jgi:DNA-binding transcriptional ArsR family regulator